MWEVTIWDKKFNEVDEKKQSNVRKYKYALAEVLSKIQDKNGDIPMIGCGVGDIKYTTKEKAGEYLDCEEFVAIPWGGTPNIKYNKGFFVTSDNRIAITKDKEKLRIDFLYNSLSSNLGQIASFYRGASIKHPSMKDVLDINIKYPKDTAEQTKISTFFKNLENLITCHQRKLDRRDKC